MSEEHRPSVSEETYKSLAEGFEKQLIEERSRSKRLAEALKLVTKYHDEQGYIPAQNLRDCIKEALREYEERKP
mgnify:CR=1 FL=1